MKYQVLSLDVWGDIDEEGNEIFEKNNFFNCGEIEIEGDFNSEKLIDVMIEEGYLTEFAKNKVEIFNSGMIEYIEILQKENEFPLFDLRLIEY